MSSNLGLLQASPLLGSFTVPKGFIRLTELEVKFCLEMLEKLGLPVDFVLLILNVAAGLVHASWASSVSSILVDCIRTSLDGASRKLVLEV